MADNGYVIYTTVEGDTFDALALAAYNDETKMNLIIEANPEYCDTLIFGGGVQLFVPIIEGTAAADSLPPWRR